MSEYDRSADVESDRVFVSHAINAICKMRPTKENLALLALARRRLDEIVSEKLGVRIRAEYDPRPYMDGRKLAEAVARYHRQKRKSARLGVYKCERGDRIFYAWLIGREGWKGTHLAFFIGRRPGIWFRWRDRPHHEIGPHFLH